MNSSNSAGDAVIGVLVAIVYLGLIVMGAVTAWIAISHSVKKRVIRGEDYNAGAAFGWYLGWSLAAGYSAGLATLIYFLVKRDEIQATALMHSELMRRVRYLEVRSPWYEQTTWQMPPAGTPAPQDPWPGQTPYPASQPAYPPAQPPYAPDQPATQAPYPPAQQGFLAAPPASPPPGATGDAPSTPPAPAYPPNAPSFYAPPPNQ